MSRRCFLEAFPLAAPGRRAGRRGAVRRAARDAVPRASTTACTPVGGGDPRGVAGRRRTAGPSTGTTTSAARCSARAASAWATSATCRRRRTTGPRNRRLIEDATRAIAAAGAVPLLVGGDDSVPIPFLAGLDAGGPLTVLQVDAHIDWRDERRGERLGFSSTMRRASEMAHVERIVQVGMRNYGTARAEEVRVAADWGAAHRHGPRGAPPRRRTACSGTSRAARAWRSPSTWTPSTRRSCRPSWRRRRAASTTRRSPT